MKSNLQTVLLQAPDIPRTSTREEEGEENKENRHEGVPAWLHVGYGLNLVWLPLSLDLL